MSRPDELDRPNPTLERLEVMVNLLTQDSIKNSAAMAVLSEQNKKLMDHIESTQSVTEITECSDSESSDKSGKRKRIQSVNVSKKFHARDLKEQSHTPVTSGRLMDRAVATNKRSHIPVTNTGQYGNL